MADEGDNDPNNNINTNTAKTVSTATQSPGVFMPIGRVMAFIDTMKLGITFLGANFVFPKGILPIQIKDAITQENEKTISEALGEIGKLSDQAKLAIVEILNTDLTKGSNGELLDPLIYNQDFAGTDNPHVFTLESLRKYLESHTHNFPTEEWLIENGFNKLYIAKDCASNLSYAIPSQVASGATTLEDYNKKLAELVTDKTGPVIIEGESYFKQSSSVEDKITKVMDAVHSQKGKEYLRYAGGILGEISYVVTFASAIYQGTQNSKYIKEIDEGIKSILKDIKPEDIRECYEKSAVKVDIETGKNKEIDYLSDDQKAEATKKIIELCKNKAYERINRDTITAGISGSTAGAGAIFTAGSLIPGGAIIAAPLAVGAAIVGFAGTGIGLSLNRVGLSRQLNAAFKKDSPLYDAINTKISYLAKIEPEKKEKATSILDYIATNLTFAAIGVKITSAFRYISPMMSSIASGAGAFIMGVGSLVDFAKASNLRVKDLKNPIEFMERINREKIYARPYIFFGESEFEKHVKNTKEYKTENNTVEKYLESLDSEKYKEILKDAETKYLKDEYEGHIKNQKAPNNLENFEGFMKERIARCAWRNTLLSDSMSTLKLTGSLCTASIFFPPLITAGLGVLVAGLVTGIVHAKNEQKKFFNKMDQKIRDDEGYKNAFKEKYSKMAETTNKDIESGIPVNDPAAVTTHSLLGPLNTFHDIVHVLEKTTNKDLNGDVNPGEFTVPPTYGRNNSQTKNTLSHLGK